MKKIGEILKIILSIVVIAGFIVFWVISDYYYHPEFRAYGKYTEGKIIDEGLKKFPYVDYIYMIGNKNYKGSTTYIIGKSHPKIGDIYPVVYSTRYHKISMMIMEQDTIKYPNAPRIGKLKRK